MNEMTSNIVATVVGGLILHWLTTKAAKKTGIIIRVYKRRYSYYAVGGFALSVIALLASPNGSGGIIFGFLALCVCDLAHKSLKASPILKGKGYASAGSLISLLAVLVGFNSLK